MMDSNNIMDNKNIETVDCLGDVCPVPIIKLKNKLSQIEAGKTIMIVTDHSCATTNIADFCKIHKLNQTATEVLNGVWEIVVSR